MFFCYTYQFSAVKCSILYSFSSYRLYITRPAKAYITNQERLQHSNQLSYQQAWRTKEKAIHQIEGDQSKQFALLPKICYYIHEHDKDSITNYELYPDRSFHRLFIAPGALRRSFGIYLRHLIANDTTHNTSRTYFFLKKYLNLNYLILN